MDTEEAVERALQFLERKAGYYTHRLTSVHFDKSKKEWLLKFDVGLFKVIIVNITLDDDTGSVTSYERPR